MIKTDAKFQVADQCPRGSDVANFSVTTVPCVLCHVAFPTDSKIYGVVNNDLILFSMLVIYFKSNTLVYFCLVKCMFCTANYYEGLNNASSGPFTEDLCSLLNAVNYLFKCLIFKKKLIFYFF